MARQLTLLKEPRRNTKLWWIVKQSAYGGSLDYRKVRRPFDSKKLTHVVFKAELGKALRFTRFETRVRDILKNVAARYGIRIKSVAVHHDHVHILFYTKSREAQIRFLRLFSAELGRRYAALHRKLGIRARKLWVARPFTRLVSWGRKSLLAAKRYIERNQWEATGFLDYKPRRHRLTAFLTKWGAQQPRSTA